ncbi:MAG: hydantoinase/oxoprolinase family protein [Deltaproteobacteria bacterium]|nr:hydantoinase/oxoprolinase family protein [Deltaproteobacteria bacterium]
MERFKIGIDIGGTFTDFLLVDEGGNHEVYKVLSTPHDPTVGVKKGIGEMANAHDMDVKEFMGSVEAIIHGTTITTNAMLTRTGARTAFVTTKGFRDVLNMRRGMKDRQYDPRYNPPPPFIPRRNVFTVEERIDCEGNVRTALNEKDVEAVIQKMKENGGFEAVAVSTLFSFLNPVNEKRIGEMLQMAFPDLFVSISSEILPQVRFYERNSTVALNAYVGPPLKRYLENALKWLESDNFKGTLRIMQCNGGVMSPEVAMRFAGNTLLSGPAGGPVAGLWFGSMHGLNNVITVDMGGTSFDACLIHDGVPEVTIEEDIGGYRNALPSLDIVTIGAGGGSIAWIDPSGLLQVGPQSAGASPGPACYAMGGTEPTSTDADLLLGYLDPDYFHGGDMKLDVAAAEKAIKEKVADKLGIGVIDAAEGIYQMINNNMAAGVSLVSVARGYDPREFALVVAGGAGPIHAGMIAKDLNIPFLLTPRGSSVFCASGMLMSDLKHDYVRTYTVETSKVDLERLNGFCREMYAVGRETLLQEGIPEDRISYQFTADLRYLAQFNEVEVSLPMSEERIIRQVDIPYMLEEFHKKHDELYGYSLPGAETELINLRLSTIGRTDKPIFKESPFRGEDASVAIKKDRKARFDKRWMVVPVYDGLKMGNGMRVFGPAIIEEPTTTVIVTPDYDLVMDAYDNYVMYPKGVKPEELIDKLRRKI